MFFATWMTSLVVLNSLLVGGWWIHYHRYLDIVEPSLSTYWYFSMQMFDRFRTFYTVLIIGLPYIFVFPLTFRLHQYPIEFVSISAKFYIFHLIFCISQNRPQYFYSSTTHLVQTRQLPSSHSSTRIFSCLRVQSHEWGLRSYLFSAFLLQYRSSHSSAGSGLRLGRVIQTFYIFSVCWVIFL